jgi:hypothetical protein
MDTALVILVLLTVLVAAVWIFRRRRDAINPMVNQGVPDLYRVGTLGRPPTAVQRGGVQGRTVSRLTRFESGRATPADVDFTSPPELFNSPEPPPREPSPHTHHHGAPFCAEAPLSGHEAHHSGGACAEAPLSGHDAHHSTSSFDSGYSTDWSSGGGVDGGGHHH